MEIMGSYWTQFARMETSTRRDFLSGLLCCAKTPSGSRRSRFDSIFMMQSSEE